MLCAALHDIDSCCLHAGVAQKVRQLCYVFLQRIKGPGEEVAEVVGEDPPGLHPRCLTEMVQLPPDVGPVHGPRCRQYLASTRHSLGVRRTSLPFPFPSAQTRPVRRVWTVTYCSSEIRTPVEAKVSMR